MNRKYLNSQPPSCTFKTETDGDKIIWIDKDTPGGKICEDDQRSLSSDNYTYDYVPGAELSATADYGNSKAKLTLAYLYDEARKKEKPIGDFDTIASIIDTQYVQLTRYGHARVDYLGLGEDNTSPFTIGDTVVVAFEYQDVNRPVVVGFRFNPRGAVKAPGDGGDGGDGEFYIKFKLNGFVPIRDGYRLKITYGPTEDSYESELSLEGEYGLCGPFTCFTDYAYAYLYYHVENSPFYYGIFHYFQNVGQQGGWDYHGYLEEKAGSCLVVPTPDYVYRSWSSGAPSGGSPIFVKRITYKKYPTNLSEITPIVEGGKTIYEVDFVLKIMQTSQINRELEIQNGILGCGWCGEEPAVLSYRAVAPGALQDGCSRTHIYGNFDFEGYPYYKSFLYTKYKNSFQIGGLVIITNQYGLNPVFQSSYYLINCQCHSYIKDMTTGETVCVDWEPDILINSTTISMITTPESVVLSTGIGGPS